MTSSGKVRIYELSRDLGLDNKDVLDAAEKLAIAARSHSSSISDEEAARIRALIRAGGAATSSPTPTPAKTILSVNNAPTPPAAPPAAMAAPRAAAPPPVPPAVAAEPVPPPASPAATLPPADETWHGGKEIDIAAVRRAIHFETARQTEALDRGEVLLQSTRRWDDDRGETTLMRSKEDAHDYRYFPDPDLLPLHTADILARVTPSLPELPHQKRARFTNDYGCSAYDADVLASEQSLAAYYEAAVAAQPALLSFL
jgi:hypothetical protein